MVVEERKGKWPAKKRDCPDSKGQPLDRILLGIAAAGLAFIQGMAASADGGSCLDVSVQGGNSKLLEIQDV